MNNLFPHRAIRLKYFYLVLTSLLVVLIGSIVFLQSYLIPNQAEQGIRVMQWLIPIMAIVLAGMVVSLPVKMLRSKVLLFIMFFIILLLGIHAYSVIGEYDGMNIFQLLLFPFNSTLAAFFPSRGDYDISEFKTNNLACAEYLTFHTLAYFYAAWLGFAIFGRRLLNWMMFYFLPRQYRNIIWGYSEGAFELAKDMIKNTDKEEPIFILDDDIEFDEVEEKRIFSKLSNESIMAISSHYDNLSENKQDFDVCIYNWHYWRRMLHTGKFFMGRRYYFITEDQDFNVKYALKILKQLDFMSDKIRDIHLYVRSELDGIDIFFQNKIKEKKLAGKVDVHIFNQSDIIARQFVENNPVLKLKDCYNPATGAKWLTLDEDLMTIDGEINILLLGLGWTGYEMMKKLVCDAQYLGDYKFNLVVIDNTYKDNNGQYQYIVKEARRFGVNICINPLIWMDKQHQICHQWMRGEKCSKHEELDEKRITQSNGHLFYQWLGFEDPKVGVPNIMRFNRIVVTLGDDELNVNTALHLTTFRNRYLGATEANDISRMPEPIFAHVQDKEKYEYYENENTSPIRVFGNLKSIYNAHNFVNDSIDRTGKLVNYVYSNPSIAILSEEKLLADMDSGSVDKEWAGCSIFNKDSSRAVAMNLENVVTVAGGTVEALEQKIQNPMYLERLAEMEHKRWNAFHYMKGICQWEIDEVDAITANGKKKINGKLSFGDSLARHICLVDFDEIDAATTRVRVLGNVNEDYKETDRRIIRHFPQLYKIYKSNKTK